MSKWELRHKPELVQVPLEPERYQQHLAQLAKIFYKQFCQLDPRFKSTINPIKQQNSLASSR